MNNVSNNSIFSEEIECTRYNCVNVAYFYIIDDYKDRKCAYFCVQLSEAIIRRSPIIENQTIQNIVHQLGVYRNIFIIIFMDYINEPGLYNRNKVLSLVIRQKFVNYLRL